MRLCVKHFFLFPYYFSILIYYSDFGLKIILDKQYEVIFLTQKLFVGEKLVGKNDDKIKIKEDILEESNIEVKDTEKDQESGEESKERGQENGQKVNEEAT